MADHLVPLFQNIGLTEQKAKETAKNKNLAPTLERAITTAGFHDKPSEKSTGALLYHLASTITPGAVPHLDYIATAIRDSKLTTADQVSAAIKFVNGKQEIDEAAFDEECGVGLSNAVVKRIATALTQHNHLGGNPAGAKSDDLLQDSGKDLIVWPSPETLMELYTRLLRDNQEVLTDQSFVVSSFTTSLAEKLEQQLGHSRRQLARQREPCGCGIDHDDQNLLDFPDDSYEDEPDEEGYEDEDDDDDDDDDDEDDEDEDDGDYDDGDDEDDEDDEYEDDSLDEDNDDDDNDEEFEDDTEQDVIYRAHYKSGKFVGTKLVGVLEHEKRMFAAMLKVRDNKKRWEEEVRKEKLQSAQKRKQEEERIQLLQRLRLEDEERRKRELQEKLRKEKHEQEMRKKREASEGFQRARSKLFTSALEGNVGVVSRILEISPEESKSIPGLPPSSTLLTTLVTGWEFPAAMEGSVGSGEKPGMQETLLHVATRSGSLELVSYLVGKGAPLDALDCDGRMPLHTAADCCAPLEICKLLLEKSMYHIDRGCVATGKTALHYAAQHGYGELVALLLQHHARVNVVDSQGNTPEMLAKAGLDREKSSKAKAQKYRSALQHIQKAITVIKEAQRQRDALVEEQRRKDEELAREEAEKDRAARRKQEEKLEADQRRREEEEKELERLKALTADPHGQNGGGGGGGGGKKKKKKKGKGGNETAPTSKETPTLPAKTLAAVSNNAVAKSNSPSPRGSPAINTQTVVVQPVAETPAPSDAVLKSPALAPKASTPSIITPSAAPSNRHDASAAVAAAAVAAPSALPTPPSPSPPKAASTRLAKVKTNYRPSQSVVARMADMGFPERDSRKALIQTEGRVEEAIELLTSGAPLAEDSEDEAERAAEEAARRKALVKETTFATTKASPKWTSSPHTPSTIPPSPPTQSTSGHPPSSAKSTNSQQTLLGVLTGAGRQGSVSAPTSKGSASHPIQILQRQPALAPHVQLRSVPTQVLQRPSMHAHAHALSSSSSSTSSRALKKSFQGQETPILTHSASPTLSASNPTPFLAPLTAPLAPPVRARYSYGASSVQSTSQPPSALLPLTNTRHHVANTMAPQLQEYGQPGVNPYSSSTLSPSMAPAANSAAQEFLWTDMPENIRPGIAQAALHPTHPMPSTGRDGLWPAQTALLSRQDIVSSPQFNATQSTLPLSAERHGVAIETRQHSYDLHSTSVDDMLRYSQMDMLDGDQDEDNDDDMIEDVLAMTGTMDLDAMENSLSNFNMAALGAPGSRPKAGSSTAVGQGRTSSSSAARNPVASLWEYGSFTQDINHLGQQWSSSQRSDSHIAAEAHAGDSHGVDAYQPWNAGSGFEYVQDMRQQLPPSLPPSLPPPPHHQHHPFHQHVPKVSAEAGSNGVAEVDLLSYVDNLVGSPPRHPPRLPAYIPMNSAPGSSHSDVSPNGFSDDTAGYLGQSPLSNSSTTLMMGNYSQSTSLGSNGGGGGGNSFGYMGHGNGERSYSGRVSVSADAYHYTQQPEQQRHETRTVPTVSLESSMSTDSRTATGSKMARGSQRWITTTAATDSQTELSAGVQALNHALEYSRYPKLNTPQSSRGSHASPVEGGGSGAEQYEQRSER
ncbi:hypothetical protein BGZ99_005120 [Dissophora globulifera]|uniref:UBA domain-containing protein n=1 Tax=Dissophora globulifera TaxID=979702 RepID=A0A9P6RGW4_9FUNG|nr:hypothetical protein BGZ99_005120 [Dissophora globulifera]